MKLDLGVERDHIESLTKANGTSALAELIWNSLDADSTQIRIDYTRTNLGGFSSISLKDDGHGLDYSTAKNVFGRLGGSEKKQTSSSPGGRQYHGKEGKGRYKALALGDLVVFQSNFIDNGQINEFTITIDRNNLSYSEISELKTLPKSLGTKGFSVQIQNINQENASFAFDATSRKELEQKFASYWISYPNFEIFFNGKKLEFNSLFKNSAEITLPILVGELTYNFIVKVIEWNFDIKKKTYLCNAKGVPFKEANLGIRSPIPISIFIQSVYVEKLHRDNLLDLENFDEVLQGVVTESKKFARNYVRQRLHLYSGEFIKELKSKGLYPYKEKADNIVEESKRQIFDIVALQVHEFLPHFDEQDDKSKKLTLSLIKEALEKDSTTLQRILSEVIELPEDKREELVDLLDYTSLSTIIDTMTEIKNRLNLINGLEQVIYEKDVNAKVKERKHLHKIVAKETWIFGDQYTYGVDDLTLKNVLKAYLKDCLHREDFQEIVDQGDNSNLQTIPDICLWHQFSMGNAGKENLVIELKKPTVDAGFTEKTQIESYATKVANDPRFPKDKTRWKFLLVTRNIKPEIEPTLSQKHRRYGHVTEGDNFDVYILPWGHILSEAKTRHEFIKEKLNLNLQNESGLNHLRSKYKEYLPDDF
jgi:hypothetical protein